MKLKITILLSFLLSINILNAQRLSTTFTKDLSRWTFDNMTFRTVFNDDWDNWECNGTKIRTTFSNDWDDWKIGDIRLRTVFSDDFSQWEITGNGQTIRVRATFINDFERFDISGDANGTIRTVFSNDPERWEITLDESVNDDIVKAIVFIPIFVAFKSLYPQLATKNRCSFELLLDRINAK
jgi:hypothetical protein